MAECIAIRPKSKQIRDKLLQVTNDEGIITRPAWTLVHKLDMFRNCPRMDVSVSVSLEKRIVNIPSSACLGGDYV